MTACWTIEPVGPVPYAPAAAAMTALVERRAAHQVPDTLVLLEHEPVYTAGRSTDPAHATWTQARMQAAGAAVATADRGGSYTFHGPGQLVGYPIVDLDSRWEIVPHIRRMEEVIIRTGADLGIELHRSERQTGVWAGDAKVCAIGVRVAHRTVTMHGFGLNCDTDLRWFDAIVPCGLADASVTTLSALAGRPIRIATVRPLVAARFAEVFDRTLAPAPDAETNAFAPSRTPSHSGASA